MGSSIDKIDQDGDETPQRVLNAADAEVIGALMISQLKADGYVHKIVPVSELPDEETTAFRAIFGDFGFRRLTDEDLK